MYVSYFNVEPSGCEGGLAGDVPFSPSRAGSESRFLKSFHLKSLLVKSKERKFKKKVLRKSLFGHYFLKSGH